MQQFDRRANTAAALSCRGFEAQATGTGNDDEMAAPNRAPKPRSGRPRSNERAAMFRRRQEENALGSLYVQIDADGDASDKDSSAMADSLFRAHTIAAFATHHNAASTWTWRPSCSQHAPQPDSNSRDDACSATEMNEQRMAWWPPHESSDHNIRQRSVLEPSDAAGRSMHADAADFSSASPTGTTHLHAIGRLLDPCICALLRHVGSVLIVIGSAPRGGGSGGDDERGEMG